MRPHVICHMVSSVDGRILSHRWRPPLNGPEIYERLHIELEGDAWLVGRITGGEFARRSAPYPEYSGPPIPREDWFAVERADAWGVVLDAQGKIAWGISDIGGDPVIVVLTRAVSDRHLAGLRADNVSYIFAGDTEIDLVATLDTLNETLGIERLLMEGGGGGNGALLAAGLIDELSLVVCPSVDGSRASPSVFDTGGVDAAPVPLKTMTLTQSQTLDGGLVWLRYHLTW